MSTVTHALAQRLRAAADAALPSPPTPSPVPEHDADACLVALVAHLRATRGADVAWLLLTTLAGAFPLTADVHRVLRSVDLLDEAELTLRVLDVARAAAAEHGAVGRPAVVVGGTVLDVDMCARSAFHNGIQRTAREIARAWSVQHDVTLVAWDDTAGCTRRLTVHEEDLAARWDESRHRAGRSEDPARVDQPLVVPWHATLVLAEVPLPDRCARLTALAEHSGTDVVAVGYDAIPVVSADLRPLGEPNGFATYLTVVKHATRVAGISASATAEFAGFRDALAAQGLRGPDVTEVMLPATVPPAPAGYVRVPPPRPLVLSVGRLEPHKNHGALLHAAQRLWREGVEFDLRLVGGPGWSTQRVQRQLDELARAGAPVRWDRSVPDAELWTLMRDASCTVFVSVHEGFGLPVAESLACGTPVLTTRYGSQGEIAASGGCLTVDPRDDEDVLAGLRRMVTDADLRATLRAQAATYPVRTWRDYTDELWSTLVEGTPR